MNENLIRPIETMENIEYIPAQIVAKYFRFLYTYNDKPIDGIAYRSSKSEDGICYALFFDQKQCLEIDSKGLFRDANKQMMKIDESSITTTCFNHSCIHQIRDISDVKINTLNLEISWDNI